MTGTATASTAEIWLVIILLGAGTYFLRLSFLGPLGRRKLPEGLLRHLRYTPVAVLPALIAPGVIWPAATGGHADPARIFAALITVVTGIATRSTVAAICAGLVSLYLGLWLVG
ncbi:AzlD domain-containing protein [Paracoccus suum]|uniref:AzlD domain-containing protein n=1 Tax=Paracoccus suum TaxID=2259340 RepID=A0A344PHA8_9RHOB|nr:AzlD domain-containing protein [Paracoccus suum]AXC48763.1 AzlD domain-containing protein [Paracoccus suum]